MPAYTTGCHGCCLSAIELPLRSGQRQCWLIRTIRAVHGFRLAASNVLRPRRFCAVSVCAIEKRRMAHTYYITAPPSVSGSRIQYTAFEVRCLAAWFRLGSQPRGFRRWLSVQWWLLVSSERVIRHVRVCVWRQYRRSQQRQERAARPAAA
jgi:hypothetical protein